ARALRQMNAVRVARDPRAARTSTTVGRSEPNKTASSSTSSEGASGCPCSVREQPLTPAESNQERAGNVVELSDVTGASWSLSLPQAGFESPASASPATSAGVWCDGSRPTDGVQALGGPQERGVASQEGSC